MSRMAESFFAASPLLALPIVSMLLFGAVFLLVTWRATRASAAEVAHRSSLPLEEDRHD